MRPLKIEEREVLERISRAQSDPASHVARARALLAVADGASYTEAARAAGRRSGDAVSQLVSRFNREGLAAVEPRHGGGPPLEYGAEERRRILAEFERQPDREKDGTATWSLNTLQRALREHGKRPSAIVELHPRRLGNRIHGAPVIPPQALARRRREPQLVSVAGAEARGLIRSELAQMGYRETLDYVCCA